jgi:hypothetical protein
MLSEFVVLGWCSEVETFLVSERYDLLFYAFLSFPHGISEIHGSIISSLYIFYILLCMGLFIVQEILVIIIGTLIIKVGPKVNIYMADWFSWLEPKVGDDLA